MLDNPFVQAFVQGWPVMLANPGVALTLLIAGGAAGYWYRGSLAKAAIEGLREQLQAKLDLLALNKAQNEDITAKHNDVSARLSVAMTDISMLTHQIRSGASESAITATTTAVVAHVAEVTEANNYLTHSISALNFQRPNDMSYIDYVTRAAAPGKPGQVPTNPPVLLTR